MKFLFDLFPVILFFVAFKLQGIYVATAVAIAASFAQIGWLWLRGRKIDAMLWVSLAIIVVFGSATLLLHDETFIKWKPSILYWTMGLSMLAGQLVFKKLAIEALLGKQMTLPPQTWKVVNISWSLFFLALGGINVFVAHSFSTETWVNFKLFGIMGFILVFALVQGLVIGPKAKPVETRPQDTTGK
jgi:intracellular septation protein